MRGKIVGLAAPALVCCLFLAAADSGGGGGPVAKVVLVVHGGAGDAPKDRDAPGLALRKAGLERALKAGYDKLHGGASSLDAVEAAVRVLEDDPWFNAGRGAVFTREGHNELDAAVMDGATLKAGAVAGVTVVKNPVSAARAVMERSSHVLLIGRGAEAFARQQGLEIVDPSYFRTEHRLKELQEQQRKEKEAPRKEGRAPATPEHYFGTVGAVAVDRHGNLAAATSTGGLTGKMPGRVGDTPVIGAGTYADNAACAVSCTGYGEFFIRHAVAHDVTARMKYLKLPVERAADEALHALPRQKGGMGGLIALDARGNAAMPYDSERMYHGWVTEDGKVHVVVNRQEEPSR
jgi:beta-aspartyl-peptidase (threonine type)